MGADPIGALPVGQGNAERAKGREPNPPLEERSHGLAFNFYSTIARSHGRTRVGVNSAGSEVLVILAASRRCGPRNRTASIPHGGVGKSRHASLVGLVDRARGIRRQCYGLRD